ncbi:MAG: hypothetical protein KGJ60_10555 [Verrucomicrobiota bacterium]|nr:hypothetical protein [Verrucomicrobiota bacterium]
MSVEGLASGNVGIDVTSVSNLIVRNLVSGFPTNYAIVPGNDMGPITASLGVAVSPWGNASH